MQNMTTRTKILKLMQEMEFSVPTRRKILRHIVNSKREIVPKVLKILEEQNTEQMTLKMILAL